MLGIPCGRRKTNILAEIVERGRQQLLHLGRMLVTDCEERGVANVCIRVAVWLLQIAE